MSRFASRHPTFVRLYVPVVVTITLVVAVASAWKDCRC